MNLILINKKKFSILSLLISLSGALYFFIVIIIDKKFINNLYIIHFIITLFLSFSPIIFYKNLIKTCSEYIWIDIIENSIISIIYKNKTTLINILDLKSYTISIPYSYMKSNDFIKIRFYLNNEKYSFCLINESIRDNTSRGCEIIDKINIIIKELNTLNKKKIILNKSFYASNIGKFFIYLNIILMVFLIILGIIYNNLIENLPIKLVCIGSLLTLISRRIKEIELYQKYSN
jgi:hypothetical protein